MIFSDYWILDENKIPVRPKSFEYYAEWCADFEKNLRVKKTNLGDVEVSTVFLGIDHDFHMPSSVRESVNYRPIVFETMVFGLRVPNEEIQERYRTWDEAIAGHDKLVEQIKSGELQ